MTKDVFGDLKCTDTLRPAKNTGCVRTDGGMETLRIADGRLNFFFQLLSHIEKLRTSMIDDLNASNVFYKKRIEELGQRLQEQNELIITQRQQVFLAIYWHCFFFPPSGAIYRRTFCFILVHL